MQVARNLHDQVSPQFKQLQQAGGGQSVRQASDAAMAFHTTTLPPSVRVAVEFGEGAGGEAHGGIGIDRPMRYK